MSRAEHLRGVGLVLAAAFSTACMGLFAKEALERGGEPAALLAARYAMVGLLLGLPLLALRRRRAASYGHKKGHSEAARRGGGMRRAAAIGVGMFFGGLFEIEALARLPLSVVIVIIFISPLWLALYGRAVRGERLGLGRQLAFGLVFAGIVCLVGPALGDYDLLGLLFALGSSFAWAGILLGIDGAEERTGLTPPAAVAGGAVVAGAIALLVAPGALAAEAASGERLPWVLAFGAAAAIGFGLIGLAMRDQHVFDVSVVAASEPLFAVLLGAAALGERLSAVQLLGVASIAAGVVLIARAYRPPAPGAAAASAPSSRSASSVGPGRSSARSSDSRSGSSA